MQRQHVAVREPTRLASKYDTQPHPHSAADGQAESNAAGAGRRRMRPAAPPPSCARPASPVEGAGRSADEAKPPPHSRTRALTTWRVRSSVQCGADWRSLLAGGRPRGAEAGPGEAGGATRSSRSRSSWSSWSSRSSWSSWSSRSSRKCADWDSQSRRARHRELDLHLQCSKPKQRAQCGLLEDTHTKF